MLFGFGVVVSMAEEHNDRRTEDFDQTPLDEPITVRWTGKLRGRVNERLGAYTSDPSNKSYDEHTVLVWRTLSRQETNVVIETVEEAEHFLTEMEWYATAGITWMNGPMRRCAERVRREVRNGLEEKRPEKEPPVSDGWGLDDLDQESRNAIFDAIYDVSDRWGVTIDDAEVFLESAGYFGSHESDDGLDTEVQELLDEAEHRAQENGRKTVQQRDL